MVKLDGKDKAYAAHLRRFARRRSGGCQTQSMSLIRATRSVLLDRRTLLSYEFSAVIVRQTESINTVHVLQCRFVNS